jgi:hypothetical protein
MISNLMAAYMANLIWAVPLTIAAVLTSFMLWMKYTNDLWWTDFWVVFPFIGKMNKWKQDVHDLSTPSSWAHEGMPDAERQLCSTYLGTKDGEKTIANEWDFKQAKEYLKITSQMDTTPTSGWMWALLVVLTVAEAAGTGLLIAPYVASKITGDQMIWIGYVAAMVMASGLLYITHFAGSQAHRYGAIRNHMGILGREHSDLFVRKIASGDDQSTDETIPGKDPAQMAKIRFANRIFNGGHDRGSLVGTFIVLGVVIGLLSVVTWMRIEGIKIQLTQQTAEQAQSGTSSANPFAGIPGMPGVSVPDSVNTDAAASNKAVHTELNSEQFSQGLAGAIVLALIYLITQGLGFLHSFKHSFIGKESEKAYNKTRGETSYRSYESKYVMPWINKAQKRLDQLRTRLKENGDYRKAPSTMSCLDYFYRQRDNRDHHAVATPTTVVFIPSIEASAANAPVAPAPALASAMQADDDEEIMVLAKKILSVPDADRRMQMVSVMARSPEEEQRIMMAIAKLGS